MCRLKIRNVTVAIVMAIGGMAVAGSANAALMLEGTTTDATGIDGLVIDSVTYDVSFVNGAYNTIYATSQPTFYLNLNGAEDAVKALQSALHTLDVTGLSGLPGPTTASAIDLLVPYEASPNTVEADITSCGTPYSTTQCTNTNPPTTPVWVYSLYAGLDPQTDFNNVDYAFFGPASATPVPAALPLFAAGLGGLGLLNWRRKRKVQALAA